MLKLHSPSSIELSCLHRRRRLCRQHHGSEIFTVQQVQQHLHLWKPPFRKHFPVPFAREFVSTAAMFSKSPLRHHGSSKAFQAAWQWQFAKSIPPGSRNPSKGRRGG